MRAGIARPLDGLPEVGMNCGDSICASDTPRSASATTSLIRRQLARTLHESPMPQLPTWTLHSVMPSGPSIASTISNSEMQSAGVRQSVVYGKDVTVRVDLAG